MIEVIEGHIPEMTVDAIEEMEWEGWILGR